MSWSICENMEYLYKRIVVRLHTEKMMELEQGQLFPCQLKFMLYGQSLKNTVTIGAWVLQCVGLSNTKLAY
jgi:hypothetical protein